MVQKAMTHLINRLQFEMNCPDEEQALGMRHNFAQTLQPRITAVIEKVCNQYVPGNEWLQIDTIEVDMGQLSPHIFDSDFEKIFLYKFEKELLAKLAGFPAEQRSNSVHQSMLALLQHFLLSGTLPWWADENEITLDEVCSDVFKYSEKLITHFFLRRQNNETIWKRAAYQLSNTAHAQLVQLLPPLGTAKAQLDELLAGVIKEISALQHQQKAVVLAVLQQQANRAPALVIENAPSFFAAGNHPKRCKNIAAAAIVRLFAANPAGTELVKKVLDIMPDDAYTGQDGANGQDGGDAIKPAPFAGADTGKNDNIAISSDTGGAGYEQQSDEDDESLIEKLLVKHAGIILLAPFLKPFFTKLQLLDAGQWVSSEAQVKGIYLLKYLADGEQQHPEYQLVLEKLLCGMPLNQPLEAAPVFLPSETAEADELLQSVLEHWKQLKNTSANGLRESFFKRDGIITAKENNWLLQVERKTVDVLLDSIPWGFSTISLPWNEYIIFTEW
jgi:Contractile injection system tape measure protein